MLKVLVTIIFLFGSGEITMTTEVDTVKECQEIIRSMTHSVGEENMIFSSCVETGLKESRGASASVQPTGLYVGNQR